MALLAFASVPTFAQTTPSVADTAPSVTQTTTTSEEGAPELEAALLTLLDAAKDPVRVAIAPVKADDRDRGKTLASDIARVLLASTDFDIVTPARIEAVLGDAAAQATETGAATVYAPLAADHVVLTEIQSIGGKAEARFRLVHVATGALLSTTTAALDGPAREGSTAARTVRGALALMGSEIELHMRELGGPVRFQRVAVAPFEARSPAVKASGIDVYVQAELIDALQRRGFLVVERDRLGEALQQVTVGEVLGEENAPALGETLGAQVVIVGSVVEAGEVFNIDARVVSVSSGQVVGGSTGVLRRENTVSLANRSLETRSPADAFFRSAVAPGWGQLYNREPVKAGIVATVVYGTAAVTLGTLSAAAGSWFLYQTALPDDTKTGAARTEGIEAARGVRDVLTLAAASMILVTVILWGANASDALITSLYPE